MTDRDWPNMTWREKTWSERGWSVTASVFAAAIVLCMFAAALYVAGGVDHRIGVRQTERANCLKHATNGLEIEQCR